MRGRTAVPVVAAVLAFAGAGWAATTVASIVGADGRISGCYLQRNGALRVVAEGTACGRGELAIEWNQKGVPGEAGPAGPAGPKGDPGPASLAGIPCETGSLDRPDGRTKAAVAATTGAITLTCVSASTNPKLTMSLWQLVDGLFVFQFPAVFEVDATGAAVSGGFVCRKDDNGGTGTCPTQRFTAGTTVRLRVNTAGVPYLPTWTGCDAVSTDRMTCTLALPAGGANVRVTPSKT